MIISVANQKGGVGKTTICMLLANYLSENNYEVLVVDIDRQRSILSQRKSDEQAFNGQQGSYLVEEWDIEDQENAAKLIEAAKQLDGVIILDTPGNVTEDGLIPVFSGSDIIICPYVYEQRCLDSTGIFIQVIEKLKNLIPDMKPEIIFVPNHVDRRIGNKEEKAIWDSVDAIFKKYGEVSPEIAYKSSVMRATTFALSSEQRKEVQNCFDFIIKHIAKFH